MNKIIWFWNLLHYNICMWRVAIYKLIASPFSRFFRIKSVSFFIQNMDRKILVNFKIA